MRQKLTIEELDNGYIVRVIKTGMSALKDPYEKPVFVFQTFDGLINYLQILKPSRAKAYDSAVGLRPEGQ